MTCYKIDNIFSNSCINKYFLTATDFNTYKRSIKPSVNSELLVIQFNARSIYNLDKFHSILEFIEQLKSNFHLIIISEIWIKTQNVNFYNINGFNSIFSCRNDRPGAGIVMYIRNDLNFELTKTDKSNFEFHYIQIKLKDFSNNHVTAIYRPPNTDIDKFFDELELTVNKKYNNIILGDINIPLNKSSTVVSDYINILLGFGIVPTNTFETRSISKNIVDHVLCGFDGIHNVRNATIFSDISDHNFIVSLFSYNSKRINKTLEKKVIDMNRVNAEFSDYLTKLCFNVSEPDVVLTNIVKRYDELVIKYTSIIKKSVKIKNTYCPWLSYDVWQLIKKKELILKKRKRQSSNTGTVNVDNNNYEHMLHELNKQIKLEKYLSKKRYFEKVFSEVPNQRELWRNINTLLGRTNNNTQNFCINVNGVVITETQEIANNFNNYFVNVGEKLASQITSDRNIFKFGTCTNVSNTCFLEPTSPTEIFNLINELENNKGGGPYLLDSGVLQSNINLFSEILSSLFNNILQTGAYPDSLKLSRVIPVFKNGDKHNISNYRPISTLPVLDKLFEKLLAVRINSFLLMNNLLYNFQYGFRKGSGTDVALVEVIDMVNSYINDQFYVFALFLDLKKAFDTVDHGLLLDKLYCYGFRGRSHELINSYLTNRKQFVFINGKTSNQVLIKYGVPQGSVLGPLLFLLFINDMGKLPLIGKLRLFADDAALFFKVKCPLEGLQYMQHDLDILLQYFNANLLSLNLSKTKYMIFRSIYKSIPILPCLTIANSNIERIESFRYLGMILDSNLNWQSHIDMVCLKISPIIGFIRKASYFIPTKILRNIYFAFIHTIITYGLIVYGNSSKSRLKKVQVLQNRSIKAIYKLPVLYSSNELFAVIAENILPIKALHFLQVVKYIYRIKKDNFGVCNINLDSYTHNYHTRNKNNLKSCNISNDYGRKRISFIGPKLYNEVSDEIKQKNYVHFKKDVRNYLKSIVTKYII